jgi:excinuclease ABC subunit B
MGRAARHVEGKAILYADAMTDSMRRAIDETDRRRAIQRAYNEENGITPQSVLSQVEMGLAHILKAEYGEVVEEEAAEIPEFATQAELDAYIAKLETEMRESAKKFEFEKAARLRDSIKELRDKEFLFG